MCTFLNNHYTSLVVLMAELHGWENGNFHVYSDWFEYPKKSLPKSRHPQWHANIVLSYPLLRTLQGSLNAILEVSYLLS